VNQSDQYPVNRGPADGEPADQPVDRAPAGGEPVEDGPADGGPVDGRPAQARPVDEPADAEPGAGLPEGRSADGRTAVHADEVEGGFLPAVKHGLDRGLSWICVVLFAALTLDVGWQVFTRQVLDSPSGWSEELAKYLFIWLGLLGGALVFGERGHIAADLAVRKLPEKAQRVTAVLVQLSTLSFAALALIWGGYRVVHLTWDDTLSGLPVNVGWMYLALPISGVITAFYSIYHLIYISTGDEVAIDPDAETALS
jgi:TRAP-type C4-dicarboxylate transport system permease small subunit